MDQQDQATVGGVAMTNQTDEIAALKKEVEALKSALSGKEDKPQPKKEFKEQPYQRYDPTEGMSMPRSALEAMLSAEPRGFMKEVALRDARAPQGPSSQGAIGIKLRKASLSSSSVIPRSPN
jgi:hypothetical protein